MRRRDYAARAVRKNRTLNITRIPLPFTTKDLVSIMSSFFPNRVINHHVGDVVTPIQTISSQQNSLGLSLNFFNGLGRPIVVINRLGVRYVIPSDPIMPFRNLVIRHSDRLHTSVNSNTDELWSVDGTIMKGAGQQIIANTFGPYNPGHSYRTRSVDFVVKPEEFLRIGSSLYLRELDLVVTTDIDNHDIHHPYSAKGQEIVSSAKSDPEVPKTGLYYNISIVDHNGVFGHRFVNFNGNVFRIDPTLNEDLDDGVYLTRSNIANGETTERAFYTERFEFGEADQALKLFRTFAEASALGSPEEEKTRQLQERKQLLAARELELRELRAERDAERDAHTRTLEREREEAKRQQALLEDELSRRKFEMARIESASTVIEHQFKRDAMLLKERLDITNTNRKQSLETLKFIPAIMLGLYAVYKAYKKLFDK